MTNPTNSQSEVTQLSGGALRVQHGAPPPEEQSPLQTSHQANRVSTGAIRYDGNQVRNVGFARYEAGLDAPTHSVMATAKRDSNGVSVELEPGNPASRTTIATAVRMGLVRETSVGYEDYGPLSAPAAGQPGEPAPQVKEPAAEDQPYAYLDREHLSEWQEMVDPIPQNAYDGAVAAAMSSIARGDEGLDNAVQRLVRESGMDPAQATELVETGEAMYRENLTRDLTSTGLISRAEADAFYDWARGHRRLPEALSDMLWAGQTRVFRDLAREFAVKKQAGSL